MTYPCEFVDKVCSEYPGSPDVKAAALGGKYGLGVHLARGAEMTMSPEDIVASIDAGECDQVRADACRAVRRRQLHAEWMRMILRSLSIMSSEAARTATYPSPSGRPSRWHALST